jgi:hypothetical protein
LKRLTGRKISIGLSVLALDVGVRRFLI